MKFRNHLARSPAGFTLLEVVLAIAVFAFGLLALIELQTRLARSSSDANLRTVAAFREKKGLQACCVPGIRCGSRAEIGRQKISPPSPEYARVLPSGEIATEVPPVDRKTPASRRKRCTGASGWGLSTPQAAASRTF